MPNLNLGDTFIWFPPDGRKEHLWIAVTDPNNNAGNFAAFNLTKSSGGRMALTFQIGDHPFITEYPSDINFGDSLIFNISKIQRDISSGRVVPYHPMNLDMVKLIAKRAIGHPAIPEEVEDLVRLQWPSLQTGLV
jgi:hypothetical protein